MPMNPEVKAKWVAALRSGEYKQHKHALRSEDGAAFCCLGVLCDISKIADWELVNGEISSRYLRAFSSLPHSVVYWAGLDGSDPLVWVDEGAQAYLSVLNDSGTPFSKIADIIEEQL